MRVQAAGNKPKLIDECIGRINAGSSAVSIARMQSPPGRQEPEQTPEFEEYTGVLRGMLRVETRQEVPHAQAWHAVMTVRDEWVRYSTPGLDGRSRLSCRLHSGDPDNAPLSTE